MILAALTYDLFLFMIFPHLDEPISRLGEKNPYRN